MVKLDEIDLDRYWRFAMPAAIAGFVASGALLVASLVSELPDAAVALDMVLFLGLFPVHLGTVLTARRGGISLGAGDHSVVYWIVRSVVSAAFFMALVYWRDLWGGPHNEAMPLGVVAAFYGVGAVAGLRYRRSAAATTSGWAPVAPGRETEGPGWRGSVTPPFGQPPLAGPPPAGPMPGPPGGTLPPAAGPMPGPPVTAQPPWAMPLEVPPGGGSPRSGWPLLRWPPPDPPRSGPRRSSTAPWRFLPPVVTAGVFFVFMATRPTTDSIVGPDHRPFYVATVVGGQPDVGADQGDVLADPPDAQRAAACRNYHDFLHDRAMGPDLVIVDDPGLVRSAELLDGEWAGDGVALDAETFLVQAGNLPEALARIEDEEWSAADRENADRYLTARAQSPSAGALDHYVIYMATRTTSSSLVVRLAVDPEAEQISKPRFTRIGDISVRLPDGSAVRINESLCWK